MLMKLTMHQVQRSASPHANWASRHPPVKGGFDIWVANRQHRVPPSRGNGPPGLPPRRGRAAEWSHRAGRCLSSRYYYVVCCRHAMTHAPMGNPPSANGGRESGIPFINIHRGSKQRGGSIGCGRWVVIVPATCSSNCSKRNCSKVKVLITLWSRQLANRGWV